MTKTHESPRFTPDMLKELAAFAEELAIAAGEAILPYFRTAIAVENKEGVQGYDPVTEADKAGERVMRAMIEDRWPGHGIVGEEYGIKDTQDGPYWVLDPVDGTRAFVAGLPCWGTLVALNDGARPVIGVMVQPYIGERFVGIHGSGLKQATMNGAPIASRACADLNKAVISTTGPDHFSDTERAAFHNLEKQAPITRYGYDCYAYAILASGFIDLVAEAGLESYDIQALIPLIEGAGGCVTTWTGDDPQQGGRILATGDSRLHQLACDQLKNTPHN